jgi:aminoglycoside/choline kinase family phosphotransferase
MKYVHLSTIGSALTLSMAALTTGTALAADPGMPKTRAEVLQELKEAERRGDIPANDESGLMKLNELFPKSYPPKAMGENLTREQVRQELMEAERTGQIPANDENGLLMRDKFPRVYPPQETGTSLTREQVRQELEEAQRTGKTLQIPLGPD